MVMRVLVDRLPLIGHDLGAVTFRQVASVSKITRCAQRDAAFERKLGESFSLNDP
jgi:hypothetical protein